MFLSQTKKLLTLFTILCVHVITATAQQTPLKVSGTVKNEKNEAVQGATIEESVNKKKTLTDSKGNFTIETTDKGVISISYVGYETIRTNAKPKLVIELKPSSNVLGDVVVIGYGTQKKKELTGAIATVTAKDFQKGNIVSPEQLIAGKVAGVSVTSNSGSPGSGSTIRIRGGASLNASNDPLIVVDGVPLSGNNIYGAANSLALINPNDIESFTVLKDAASTAIYGSRASNGVILITTKKGASGKPVFTFTTQVSVSKIRKYVDVMSANEFRNYVDSLGTEMYDDVHTFKSLLGTANTDWQKEIYQTALGTDNYLGIAGSIKKLNLPYRVTLGYYRQDGILKTDNLQRITAGISTSPKFFDNHLRVDINLKGAATNTRFANNAAISSSVYFDPTQPVHVPTDIDNYYGGYFEWTSYVPEDGNYTLNKLAPKNPVALLYLYKNTSTVQRSFGNIQFDYKFHFLPELRANLNLGYDVAKGSGTILVPRYAAQNFLEAGQRNKYSNHINNKVGEFYLNYTKNLNSIKSNINVTAGTGYYNNLSINDSYYSYRYNGDSIPGTLNPNDKPENTLISYYGRLIYTYNTKYILAASIRTDGSSRFAKENRWGTFPSIALTWRLNQEKFFSGAKKLSDLKLRLSYGVTGQQDGIPNYGYQSVYTLGQNTSLVQFGDTYYQMGTPNAYDKSIKWEQTSAFNIGIDFGFLNNKISGKVDFYKRRTTDLLNFIPLPAGSNFTTFITTNIGTMDNQGVELTLNYTPVKTKDIVWDLSLNAGYNKNKIVKLTATSDSSYPGTQKSNGIQINSVGYAPESFYVYHQQYDAKTGKPIEGVYRDINEDGIINEKDLYRYQSSVPKYVLGFTTEVSYKKWSLNTVLRANIDNYVYNGISTSAIKAAIFNPLGFVQNSLKDVTYTSFQNGQNLSDYYIENASFLKMDNIQIGYNFGKVFNNKADLKINANCQNVFTITKYTGLDPEIFGGTDYVLYPRPRIFVLGLALQF
ncbi:SusC/RagA family TonB-linked outer membrane protein [Ferruginibacter sp. SUN002]|uniref:SusC/RagA family TonB-linked outer membrane protein n=1 Tax=Ferruginibacter sp. SUN002 TaxID=2937789 RepID=UPI003D362351